MESLEAYTVWVSLLASEASLQTRKLCEEAFHKLKVDSGGVMGSVYVCEVEND